MALFSDHPETATELITKVMPPVAVSGLTLFGFSLPDLVQLVTFIYVGVLLLDKLYNISIRYFNKKNEPSE